MDAFRDHGEVKPDVIEQDVEGARAVLAALEEHGISLKEVTDELVKEGVQQFADAFDKLFGAIAQRRRTLLEGERARLEISAGLTEMKAAFDAEMEVWRKDGRIRRLWAGDKSLWAGTDEDKWVGWLHIVEQELADLDRLHGFAERGEAARVHRRGPVGHGRFEPGAGGAERNLRAAGWLAAFPYAGQHRSGADQDDRTGDRSRQDTVHCLLQIRQHAGAQHLHGLFLRPRRRGAGKDKAGEHFVAVTDPGSPLERASQAAHFAHVFHGAPSIGGRYSVLSKFGLVPAAAMGLDVKRLLETTRTMQRSCGADVPPSENPGVQLGVAMGVAATRFGRDKVTIIASPGIADLGAWLEQLLAESTGKQGRGLIPLAGEPLTVPECYGSDRFFAYLELDGQVDPSQRQAVEALERAGHPVARISVKDIWHIGQEFFRWEIATAVAGVDHRHRPVRPAGRRGEQGQDARADRCL